MAVDELHRLPRSINVGKDGWRRRGTCIRRGRVQQRRNKAGETGVGREGRERERRGWDPFARSARSTKKGDAGEKKDEDEDEKIEERTEGFPSGSQRPYSLRAEEGSLGESIGGSLKQS
ncbi:hypothetical protein TESG_08483 [Trichophyton tonsurans CBS 112818]|uniref:Uncharacterized protein n=1 Tax=Trichophyton tonsurans (strain CBS 112818) TaxID=647933 RepID=F2S0M9_TRIT1|nr:hypothetical protein TESG_08483 [Trichophyton tonsurans CBS 112818]